MENQNTHYFQEGLNEIYGKVLRTLKFFTNVKDEYPHS